MPHEVRIAVDALTSRSWSTAGKVLFGFGVLGRRHHFGALLRNSFSDLSFNPVCYPADNVLMGRVGVATFLICYFRDNFRRPAEFHRRRTSNPATAARMIYCSPKCRKGAWLDRNREAVYESNRRSGAAWYAKLSPEAKAERFSQIAANRKKTP